MTKNKKVIDISSLPAFAQKQALNKAKFETKSGTYYGGSSTRRGTGGWRPPATDADSATLTDRATIVNRSEDLIRNSPIAGGAINTNCLHVVGDGIKMQARINRHVLQISEREAQQKQKEIESEWKLFAESMDCSYDRRSNFYDMENLTLRSALGSGDVFALLPYEMRTGSPYGLKVQLIEGNRVSNEGGKPNTKNLVAGVHMNDNGAPVAYDFRIASPGSDTVKNQNNNKWTTVDAFSPSGRRRVLHVYEMLRPSQTRGMPYLAPIIEIIKQLSKYTNAEIAAAVVNSYFTVFLESEDGQANFSQFAMKGETQPGTDDKDYKLGMAAFVRLGKGEKVTFADPKRPNNNFEAFVMSLLRQIGAALSIPYELLNYQFSSSYSASRAAMLLAWKMFKTRRTWLENHFCNHVYAAWFEEAVLLGRVVAPGFMEDYAIRAAYLRNKWIGPNPGQIDAVKETSAALDRIGGRLTTISEESAAIGGDFEDNVAQTAYEERVMDEADVSPVGDGARNMTGIIGGSQVEDPARQTAIDNSADDSDDEDPNNPAKGNL